MHGSLSHTWLEVTGSLREGTETLCILTDISSEHSLRTCTQIRRNVRKSDVVYACKIKIKNATEVTVSGIHDLTLWSGAFITREPPMCSPLFLPKESSHKCAVVFVKVIHFWGEVRRTIVSNRKACESPFSSSPFRLRDFRLVRRQRQDRVRYSVPRPVQRHTGTASPVQYRVRYSVKPLVVARVHVAERFPADELLTARVEIVRPRAG